MPRHSRHSRQLPTHLQQKRFYRLNAPAKVNLGLRILGKDHTGFHRLETVFHCISLQDTIHIQIDPMGPCRTVLKGTDDGVMPYDETNSAYRAIECLRQLGCPLGLVDIRIDKGIPIGGGLGGSSADSAAILKGLQHYLPNSVPRIMLEKAALSLGSDVPFLLRQGCAHALGRGEILSPLPSLAGKSLWLIVPPKSCATPTVFRALTDPERQPRSPLGPAWWKQQWSAQQHDFLSNDLLKAALRVEPSLHVVTDWLNAGQSPWAMSGSGSTFYTLSKPDKDLPPNHQCIHCTFI